MPVRLQTGKHGGFLETLAMHSSNWTPDFAGAVITIATQRLLAYLVPNGP